MRSGETEGRAGNAAGEAADATPEAVRGRSGALPPDGAPSSPSDSGPRGVYADRRRRFTAEEALHAGRSRVFSWARLVVALGALFLVLRIVLDAAAPPAWPFLLLVTLVLLFLVLAVLHGRVLAYQRRSAELVAIQDEGLARLDHRWDALPPGPPPPADRLDPHGGLPPVARDLGLFGPISVARLLSTVRTPAGEATLAGWLLDPAPPAEIRRRQPAVAELATELDLRQELELAGRSRGRRRTRRSGSDGDPEAGTTLPVFLAWAEGEPWLLHRPALRWIARLSPPLVAGMGVAAVSGLLPGSLAALLVVGNLLFTWAFKRRLDERFGQVAAGPQELATYAAALAAVEGRSFRAPALQDLAAELTAEGESAAAWMRRLARRVDIADARHGSFHVLTQVVTLWDFHALELLERWQRSAGPRVRRWLQALGELEALAALGSLAHDHPGWAFPEVATEGPASAGQPAAALAARGLGHPLIPDDRRVGNDVRIGPPGTFLLVTGSNMSGKSTLLRSLGVNVALGQAGGPVCAERMELPPLELGTSILVEDSLADGVSFFYAELLRLKQVVDLADRTRGAGRTLLYLLDEVLRGTNSRERRIAVVRVLHHLLEAGAIGAISTHDLELGTEPAVAAAAEPVHFRETLHRRPGSAAEAGGEEENAEAATQAGETGAGEAAEVLVAGAPRPAMTFDYRLRPGPATTTNALALLAAVGLDAEPPQ